MGKRIKWMTELPERCDHPEECLILDFDLLDMPLLTCQKCGYKMGKDEHQARLKLKNQMKLVTQ